jgi:hypothetical protein
LTLDPNGDDPEKWIEVESKVGLKLVEDEPETKSTEEPIPAQ